MNYWRFECVILVLATLCGCGGGDGGDDGNGSAGGAPTAQGLYVGKTADDRALWGFVLDNGTYWFVYSYTGSNGLGNSLDSTTIAGAIQGNGSESNGSFSSTNAKDFSLENEKILNLSVSSSFTAQKSLNGTLTYSDGTKATFASQYESDFDTVPNVASLAGTYTGAAIAGDSDGVATDQVTINVSSSGSVSGIGASGCKFSGNVTAHTHGNVYDVSITFAGGVCSNDTNTVKGIAYLSPKTGQLFSAGVNDARDNGFIFLGNEGTK